MEPYYVHMTTTEAPHHQSAAEPAATWVPELNFGARLALVRHRMGWNIKEAAAACGVPAQSWRGWEIQGREPHRLTTIAMTIATQTGCDYLWLVHGPDRGGSVRRSAYVRERVISRISHPESDRMIGPSGPHPAHPAHGRSVRQTRPVDGALRRPLTPTAV